MTSNACACLADHFRRRRPDKHSCAEHAVTEAVRADDELVQGERASAAVGVSRNLELVEPDRAERAERSASARMVSQSSGTIAVAASALAAIFGSTFRLACSAFQHDTPYAAPVAPSVAHQ